MGYSIKEKFVTKLQKIPFSIPFLITVICIYGFVILYSAAGGQIEPWAYRQIIIFSIFMVPENANGLFWRFVHE